MKAHLLSTVGFLFIAAVSGGCGSNANLDVDGEVVGEVDQAFSEANCANALPNNPVNGSFPNGQNPDNTWTGQMYWAEPYAPYTNPKCYGAWVTQINRAYTGLLIAVYPDLPEPTEREGCEDRHVGLLVYSRVSTGPLKGPWSQYFLGRSYGVWSPPGYRDKCHIEPISLPPLPPPKVGADRDVKIIGTGRDPNNDTTTITLFGEKPGVD